VSANNYLSISKKTFKVRDLDSETGKGSDLGQGETLEEAIEIAEEFLKENEVEYGIWFT